MAGLAIQPKNNSENISVDSDANNDIIGEKALLKTEESKPMEIGEAVSSTSNSLSNVIDFSAPLSVESKAIDAIGSVNNSSSSSTRQVPFPVPSDTPAGCIQALSTLLKYEDIVQLQRSVVIMRKYLKNILQEPYVQKYRSINTANGTYQEKVRVVPGAEAFLSAVGFVEMEEQVEGSRRSLLRLPLRTAQEEGGSEDEHRLQLKVLHQAEQILASFESHLTRQLATSPAAPAVASGAPAPTPVTFDPFQTHIVRINPQVTN